MDYTEDEKDALALTITKRRCIDFFKANYDTRLSPVERAAVLKLIRRVFRADSADPEDKLKRRAVRYWILEENISPQVLAARLGIDIATTTQLLSSALKTARILLRESLKLESIDAVAKKNTTRIINSLRLRTTPGMVELNPENASAGTKDPFDAHSTEWWRELVLSLTDDAIERRTMELLAQGKNVREISERITNEFPHATGWARSGAAEKITRLLGKVKTRLSEYV